MAVDNQVYPIDTSALAADVAHIAYDVGGGNGGIEYTDRPALSAVFTDPSPYQPYLNAWLTVAAAAIVPLTVAAAQSIKQALLDRVRAINAAALLASFGGYLWDASDYGFLEALQCGTYAMLIAPPPPPPVLVSAIAGPAGGTNAMRSNNSFYVNTVAGIAVNSTMTDLSQAALGLYTVSGTGTYFQSGTGFPYVVVSSNISGATVAANDTIQFSVPPAPITNGLTPSNGPEQTMTGVQIAGLIGAITAARRGLTTKYQNNSAALAATSSVAAVIAFDVTAGW
jgi:hypothetical protein